MTVERSSARVLLAVSDPERERALASALEAAGLIVAARCLDAPTLLDSSRDGSVDGAVVSSTLHRLTPATLAALRERRLPVVLLAPESERERYAGLAHVLSGASAQDAASAVLQAVRHGATYAGADVRVDDGDVQAEAQDRGEVVALTSGKGAPGKTVLAIALAAALAERGRRVALVDADLRGGDAGAWLDLDLRRGLVGLAGPGGAGRVLEELQQGPGFAVLAGIERAGMARGLTGEVLRAALEALRARFEHVLVDAGPADGGPASELLRAADRVLIVTGADLVSIWNAQRGLRALRDELGMRADQAAAVINRREGREHYGPDEVEQALGLSVLGAVREDRAALRRAAERQEPLTSVGGRAARDARRLAIALLQGAAAAQPAKERRRRSVLRWRRQAR